MKTARKLVDELLAGGYTHERILNELVDGPATPEVDNGIRNVLLMLCEEMQDNDDRGFNLRDDNDDEEKDPSTGRPVTPVRWNWGNRVW
jgi:hypothetical protein